MQYEKKIKLKTPKSKKYKNWKRRVAIRIKKMRERLLTRSLITFRLLENKVTNYAYDNCNTINVRYRLKNALRILFRYHINGKRILFVGGKESVCCEVYTWLKKTNHYFIPSLAWLGGIISNLKENFPFEKMYIPGKYEFNAIEMKKFTRMKNKSHIIVAFDEIVDKEIIPEISRLKVPFITFNSALNAHNLCSDYKIQGNFMNPFSIGCENLLIDLLQSFIKKSNNIKKHCRWLLHLLKTLKMFKKRKKWRYTGKKKFFKNQKGFRNNYSKQILTKRIPPIKHKQSNPLKACDFKKQLFKI